jgi:hypothetical protein
MESARARESARPKARIVTSRDADPRGPTMLSSPPVNSSLQLDKPAPRRNSTVPLLLAALVALVLGGLAWAATRPNAASPTASGELASLPQLAAAAPAGLPTASEARAAAPLTSGPAETARASKTAAVKTKQRPQPAAATPTAPPRIDSNDDKLFSGRK